AGEVIVRAALEDGSHDVWTWFDHANHSLADVLVRLCDAWGVIPRITELAVLAPLGRATIERLGAPRELLEYADPLPEIAPEVLTRLPADLPRCPSGYVEATSEALRGSSLTVRAA